MSFFDGLKNIFVLLIILQLLPSFFENIKKQYGKYIEQKTSVGVIKINKILFDSAPVIKHMQTFFKNNDIKAVVLRIDCAGTAAGTAQLIFHELLALKQQYPKPVVALVENTCASGGYWITCGADYIIAPGSAIIGSIGALFPHIFQLRQFLARYDIDYVSLKAGTYKGSADPFSTLTSEEQALLQSVLNDSYDQFVQAVAQARKLSIASASEWADGKIFTGQQAQKLGLIDELGSVDTLVKAIKDRALIEGEIDWIHSTEPGGIWQKLFGTSNDDESSMVSSVVSHVCTHLEQRYASVKLQ